jgi:hypothetical protein
LPETVRRAPAVIDAYLGLDADDSELAPAGSP